MSVSPLVLAEGRTGSDSVTTTAHCVGYGCFFLLLAFPLKVTGEGFMRLAKVPGIGRVISIVYLPLSTPFFFSLFPFLFNCFYLGFFSDGQTRMFVGETLLLEK